MGRGTRNNFLYFFQFLSSRFCSRTLNINKQAIYTFTDTYYLNFIQLCKYQCHIFLKQKCSTKCFCFSRNLTLRTFTTYDGVKTILGSYLIAKCQHFISKLSRYLSLSFNYTELATLIKIRICLKDII